MNTFPQKTYALVVFLFVFSLLISCSKDTDLLIASVLNEDKVSVEENDGTIDQTAELEGYEVRSFSFSPINDAYLQDDEGFDQSIIRLEEDHRTSYLMFDLSQINGPIKEAVLEFSVEADAGDGNISIFKGNSTDWTEEDLTEYNAPQADSQLGAINKEYKLGSSEKVALNASKIQPELTTLVMVHQTGDDLALASKEHPQKKGPKLIVTYEAPEGSEEIVQEEEIIEEETPEEEILQEETPQPNNDERSVPDGYYVTVNGKASNDGKSEATAWSIEHAFSRAMAGDIVYIKAGNYGNIELEVDNSGISGKPIKFIGYTNVPGDIISNNGSTYKYGENLDPNKMPLIKGNSNMEGIGLDSNENHVEIHNLQISNYWIGVNSKGSHTVLRNIITNENGMQTNNSSQTGRGFQIHGDFTMVEDCFSLNSNAEGINLKGASNCVVKNTQVYSDNLVNMGGYYIAITFGGENNIIEGCTIYRDPSGDNTMDPHQGHGYVLKDMAVNNTIKNCKAYNTGIEVNFSGVHSNTFTDVEIFGKYSTYNYQFSSCIAVKNGAHDNIFRNITIEDTRYPVSFIDHNDGFVGPGGDRDENEGGDNNKFYNLKVNKSHNIIFFNSVEVGWSATSKNNEFYDCTFQNVGSVPFITKQTTSGTKFVNSNFENIPSTKLKVENGSNNTLPIDFQNCNFQNVGFSIPN